MVVNRWTVILNPEEAEEEGVSLWWWENLNFDYHGHLSFSLILLACWFFFTRRMKQPVTNSRNSSRRHCRMLPLTTSTPSLEVVSLEYPMLCIELALDWDYFCSFWSPLLQTTRLFWWWVFFEYPFVILCAFLKFSVLLCFCYENSFCLRMFLESRIRDYLVECDGIFKIGLFGFIIFALRRPQCHGLCDLTQQGEDVLLLLFHEH